MFRFVGAIHPQSIEFDPAGSSPAGFLRGYTKTANSKGERPFLMLI
jgi:hypothetical protein